MSIRKVINKYHIWDARRILDLVPNKEFVDVTITSPPYWNLKNYGMESQIGFGQKYDDYLADLGKVFEAVYSITKPRGSLWIISDTIKDNGKIVLLPFDLAQRLKEAGWTLQDIIIWQKDRTLPWSHQGKLRNIFEYIAFYSKGPKFTYHRDRVRDLDQLKEWWVRYPERYSPEGKAPSRIWWIPIPRQGSWGKSNNWVNHFNPFPPELVKRMLLLTTSEGDVVLDPFSGSGTVPAQAYVMGRKYIGLDLNEGYREMFQKQVLPAIKEQHKQTIERNHQVEQKKKRFSSLVHALRITKYPKELIRLYGVKGAARKLRAVIAIKGPKEGQINVDFIFPRNFQVPKRFISRMQRISNRPPLSKYGIRTTLSAYTIDTLRQKWVKDRNLDLQKLMYLYVGGRTYAWAKRITAGKLLELLKKNGDASLPMKKYPPIYSNVQVKIDLNTPFATAVSRNDEQRDSAK